MKPLVSGMVILFAMACEPEPADLGDTAEYEDMELEEDYRSLSTLAGPTLECSEYYPNVSGQQLKADVTATGTGTGIRWQDAAQDAYKKCIRKIQNRSQVSASWQHNGDEVNLASSWTCDDSNCPDPRETCGRYWFYTDRGNVLKPVGLPRCGFAAGVWTCDVDCEVQIGIQWGCSSCSRGGIACMDGGEPVDLEAPADLDPPEFEDLVAF